jgi:hypothetical protein
MQAALRVGAAAALRETTPFGDVPLLQRVAAIARPARYDTGVLVSAVGQMLMATVDNSINTCTL